jgi:uncharacterized membrane protein YdjX (TVP38/TMEM64 family)
MMNETHIDESYNVKRFLRIILFVLLIIVIATISYYIGLEGLGEVISVLKTHVESAGILGPLLYSLFYIGAVIIMLPGTILGVLAGLMFGSVAGVIIVSVSSTIGSGLSFLIARYLARDLIMEHMLKYKKLKRLYDLTETEGAVIVGVTRLIPLFPFNLLNYAFGLTKVKFRTYIFWSWLCMLPGTIVIVVGSDAVAQSIIKGEVLYDLYGVVAVLLCVLLLITWYIKKHSLIIKKLKEHER